MKGRASFVLVNRYVGREYILSFLMSFAFFFFVYFINQILVLAQKILLKNVQVEDVLILVVLSIPQFLMYTMPFSSLAAASMVVGNFSSQNEILAMRSSGIHSLKIFRPIIFISLFFTFATFLIADRMIPYSAEKYREMYANILQKLPTVELDSYSSTQFGKMVISNGEVEGSIIHDVVILDDSDHSDSRVVSASEAEITLIDLERFIYRIDLKNPQILMTDSTSLASYSLATAEEMTMYLTLSNNNSGYNPVTPSQMSIRQLMNAADGRRDENAAIQEQQVDSILTTAKSLGKKLMDLEDASVSKTPTTESISSVVASAERLEKLTGDKQFSFYYQYYRSELYKKLALSAACTFLVLVAFPISFFRVKNGRFLGLGISVVVAAAYWYLLYFMHTRAIVSALNPFWFLWFPNMLVFAVGITMVVRLGRK